MKRLIYILFGVLVSCGGGEPIKPDNLTDLARATNPTLVNTNATQSAKNVYTFLRENYGKNVILGTMADYGNNIREAEWVKEQTGKWSALNGFDFIDCTRNQSWQPNNNADLIAAAKAWWTNRGLVNIMWHWRDPSRATDAFYTKSANANYTTFDVSKISNPSSTEYGQMIADIDIIAGLLKELQTAGVPVLWRPLHEASGAWFWWGAKGALACKTLWQTMYDRLVNYHGLNNLIWIWTTEGNDMTWYPGDEYVDIVGRDLYNINFAAEFEKVRALFGGKKIVTLSECGKMPIKIGGEGWSWVMPWYGSYTHETNSLSTWTNWVSSDQVITRDEMPDLR